MLNTAAFKDLCVVRTFCESLLLILLGKEDVL